MKTEAESKGFGLVCFKQPECAMRALTELNGKDGLFVAKALKKEQREAVIKRVTEWVRFWKVLGGITFGCWPAFYTFEIYAGDGAPSLSWMAENWNFWQTQSSSKTALAGA